MHKLAIRITDYLIARGVSKKSERDFYIYGCEILLLKIVNVGTLLCIAGAMGNPVEGIILLLTFMTLRKYTGGFHLGSALGCYMFTALVYVSSLYLCVNYVGSKAMCFVIVIISEIIIVSLAPIDNPNLNLTEMEIKSMKKQIKRLVVLLSVILIVLMLGGGGMRFISPIVLGIGLDAMFMGVAIIHKKRGERVAEGKKKRLGVNRKAN